MHPESTQAGPAGTRRVMRVDGGRVSLVMPGLQTWAVPLLAVMAIGFVLLGAGNLDLGPVDARQGLAASEPLGPLGQVCGSWAPDLWPGRVAASRMATLFEGGGRPTPGSVLWPAALAAVAIGWTLARRMMGVMGRRAGLWVGLCWFGCLGVIDHSGGTGLELLSGLAIVAAIDRLLAHGSDWKAGLWAALAFLSGGWPPVVLILLAVIVIGRRRASFSAPLVMPPLATAVAWSVWAMSSASTEAWAAAVVLPFTEPGLVVCPGSSGPRFAFLTAGHSDAQPEASRQLERRGQANGHRLAANGNRLHDRRHDRTWAIPDRPRSRAGGHPARRRHSARRRLGSLAGGAGPASFPRPDLRSAIGMADYPYVRQLSLAADLSLLPLSRDSSGSPERAGLWARMACGRDSEHSPWPGRSGLPGNHFEAGALGLLCTRMELPPWPGSLGSSGRPVAPTQLDGLHVSRLAARPGLRNRPPGLPAPQPSAPGFSGDKAVQACTPAGFGVRSLARRCPCLVQGGHVSRPIRWSAGPGTHRGRSDNTDSHLYSHDGSR